MSHYTVAVFHRPDQEIEDLLAPYDENLEVEPYIRFTRQQAIDYARENYAGFAQKSDDECYAAVAEGYMADDDGNLLSTYNPDSKWDWYSEGGRWEGFLKLKGSGETCNSARIGDVDFSPDHNKYEDALEFWDAVVDHKVSDEEAKRRFSLYNEKYYREYYKDRETYAKRMTAFTTYAVITPDGVWHGKGEMGWFGLSSESSDDADDWDTHYMERFIDAADPDQIITIVDCHI